MNRDTYEMLAEHRPDWRSNQEREITGVRHMTPEFNAEPIYQGDPRWETAPYEVAYIYHQSNRTMPANLFEGMPIMPQEEINRTALEYARQHDRLAAGERIPNTAYRVAGPAPADKLKALHQRKVKTPFDNMPF
jgi:hypothetical protein